MTGTLVDVRRPASPPTANLAAAPQAVRFSWIMSTAAVWLIAAGCGVWWSFYVNNGVHGLDAHAYWSTAHRANLYGPPPGSVDAYLYSPVFSTVIRPIAILPWHAFLGLWMAAETAAFVWLLKPLGVRWGVPAFFLCLIEVSVGNVYSFFAVVAVLGLRRPVAWALPLLTKMTPGLGPVWFAVRREWRSLAISLAVTVAIAAVSVGLTPHQWAQWLHFLATNAGENQWYLPVRVIAAVALTVAGAVKGKPWVLAPAMLLANPVIVNAWMGLTVLAAVPRLWLLSSERTDAVRVANTDTMGVTP